MKGRGLNERHFYRSKLKNDIGKWIISEARDGSSYEINSVPFHRYYELDDMLYTYYVHLITMTMREIFWIMKKKTGKLKLRFYFYFCFHVCW
jgi:hypothetical protein